MVDTVLGIIGGSGIYEIEGLKNAVWRSVESPWGSPSDQILTGQLSDVQMAFLPRHGRGHPLSPSGINYRANIDAMKRLGVTDIISLSACGSFKESLSPGTFVIVDQFIDRTVGRERSFFGNGLVAHVSLAEPVCPRLTEVLAEAAAQISVSFQRGGTYLAIEGPQFSSEAESHLYQSWGCDVIGMTNMPEARLAREAEIAYASVAMVTDYDCWHEDHDAVEVTTILEVLQKNAENARTLVKAVAPMLGPKRTPSPIGCETALDTALITAPEARDPHLVAKLDAVAGRVLNK